mgnify:CR=1 FL=1
MSEFRNLPQQFSVRADDEFLVVGASGPHRITARALQYDNFALLKFDHPADQAFGVGTPDSWTNIPFNNLKISGAVPFINLNANGTFSLSEGIYKIVLHTRLFYTLKARIALEQDNNKISFVCGYSGAGNGIALSLVERIDLDMAKTMAFSISVSNAYPQNLHVNDSSLSGSQTTLVTCEIYKLG